MNHVYSITHSPHKITGIPCRPFRFFAVSLDTFLHKAQSTKHKAQSTKHKAQSTKHKAQSTKHKAQSTKHKAFESCAILSRNPLLQIQITPLIRTTLGKMDMEVAKMPVWWHGQLPFW